MINVVGMIEQYKDEQLVKFIKSQNDVWSEKSDCKVMKIWATKNKRNIFQALLEVDVETFCKIMKQGNLFVNYDVCAVYDATDIKICYKCSGLNHVAKSCSNSKIVCPKCSLEHTVKECPSTSLPICINCVNAGLDENNHFVWDKTKCTVYIKKLEHHKLSIFCKE